MEQPTLLVQKMHPLAVIPSYQYHSAGLDLSSVETCTIFAHGKRIVGTGLRVAIPTGHYGRIAPRSGIAATHFIDVGAGVIDEDYRGEICVLLFNFGNDDYHINAGDRIVINKLNNI